MVLIHPDPSLAAARVFWGCCLDVSPAVFVTEVLPPLRCLINLGGPLLRRGGPYGVSSLGMRDGEFNTRGPPTGLCLGLCCFSQQCCRLLLQWCGPLLQLVSPHKGDCLQRRGRGPPDACGEGPPVSATLLEMPPPGDVPCQLCCSPGGPPALPWKGVKTGAPYWQRGPPAATGFAPGGPLGGETDDIEEIEED